MNWLKEIRIDEDRIVFLRFRYSMFNSAITLSFYVDVFPEDLEEAAEVMQKLVYAGNFILPLQESGRRYLCKKCAIKELMSAIQRYNIKLYNINAPYDSGGAYLFFLE